MRRKRCNHDIIILTFNFITALGHYETPQVYAGVKVCAFKGEREPKEKHEEKEYQEKMDGEGRGRNAQIIAHITSFFKLMHVI